MRIGFLGTGIMGRPMAGHLQAAGHELLLAPHRSPAPEELVAGGATLHASARELAAAADVVILMLPDTPDVERALFGEEGVVAGLRAGTLVIDMSSIDPIATRDFAARVAAVGCDYVDAPVSGGEVGAKAATLTIMCGGSDTAFARAEPLFRAMGKNVTLVGAVGAGQVAKVANQIIVALNIAAVGEALVFASKAGVDPDKVRAALLGGFAGSRVLEVHGQRMIDRSFAPGFRIALHQKDLNLALGSARSLGLALPGTAGAQQLFSACVARGGADWDHSALVRALEALADHDIARTDA
ncbi:2-hydroxy-3-oxopropionate reductase [Sphingomonas sp. BK235]|uniref:2-hydroxy-3-oxopropionate reductase n=1 Tax=Sphingomonas sp. BK235 TaxID=2512131 RepID=UPI00104A4101|nr:2-hydroxy-3-oxopropionate reductase [Sphingomonas sp. BK235]TCP37529.1 2-hydroxy-3-oxopropionate reductase [Sphingomonas sp. BK235]